MSFPSNWLTIALKPFCIKSYCILLSHWLLRESNCLLSYHIWVICLLLLEYTIVLRKIFIIARSRLFLDSQHILVIFFCFKDKVPFNLCSNVVYKFLPCRCNATYHGKICQHFNNRVGKYLVVSPLTTSAVEDMFYR